MEWVIPAFSFPAEVGPHLLTQEGWKAELNVFLALTFKYAVCID